jgi:hypothetical protein
MQKIPTLFQRNHEGDKRIRNEVTPGCEWVLAGEGVATRKFDGTCCMIRGGRLFKRYDAKNGRIPPVGFEPSQEADPVTGHQPGWVPVGDGPEDMWHREAFDTIRPLVEQFGKSADGLFELVGPKVQGNPEQYDQHMLVSIYAEDRMEDFHDDPPRDFDGLRAFLETAGVEGIVWHHGDGRMAKIKAKDFGLKRRSRAELTVG